MLRNLCIKKSTYNLKQSIYVNHVSRKRTTYNLKRSIWQHEYTDDFLTELAALSVRPVKAVDVAAHHIRHPDEQLHIAAAWPVSGSGRISASVYGVWRARSAMVPNCQS